LHVFIASSGNAGLAAAVAARTLAVKCTVYLPVVVAKDTQDVLRKQGANVVLVGQIYSDALEAMYKAAEQDPHACVECPSARWLVYIDPIFVQRCTLFV
jgi:L-serine/L-threonine ammonia-lyase